MEAAPLFPGKGKGGLALEGLGRAASGQAAAEADANVSRARLRQLTDVLNAGAYKGKPLTAQQQKRLKTEIVREAAQLRQAGQQAAAGREKYEGSAAQRLSQAAYEMSDTMAGYAAGSTQEAKRGLGPVGQFAVDLGVQGAHLGAQIAANAAAPGISMPMLAVRSAGGASREARQAGAGYGGQLGYAAGSGALSVFTEHLSNLSAPFKKAFGKGVLDDVIQKTFARLNSTAAGRVALSALSEGGEEVIESLVNPILKQMTYDQTALGEYKTADYWAGVLYDGLVGGTMGAIGGTAEHIARRGTAAPTAPAGLVSAAAPGKALSENHLNGLGTAGGQDAQGGRNGIVQNDVTRPVTSKAAPGAETQGTARAAAPAGRDGTNVPHGTEAAVRSVQQSMLDEAAKAFGESGRKAIRAAYDGRTDLPAYYAAFSAWYGAGVNGQAAPPAGSRYAGGLTQAQRFAALSAGQNDAAASLKQEQAAALRAETYGDKGGIDRTDPYVREILEAGQKMVYADREGTSHITAAEIEQMDAAAKALGVRVRFADFGTVQGGAANAQISGREVLVEKNNPNPLRFLMGHELEHRVQQLAPEAHRAFRAAVAQDEARVLRRIAAYAEQGVTLTYEQALDEIAADVAGEILDGGQVLDDFIARHRGSRTLLEALRDAVRWLIGKLTGSERRRMQTAEGKLSAALDAAAAANRALGEKNAAAVKTAPDDTRYSLVGTTADGIEVYETSEEVRRMPYKQRMEAFLTIMQNEYAGRTAKFVADDGNVYYAKFDESDLRKNVYGDRKSSRSGWKAKISTGADGSIFELVENTKYQGGRPEQGKQTAAHRNVTGWEYFVKTVQIDGKVYDLLANVRKKPDGEYLYSIQLNEDKRKAPAPPRQYRNGTAKTENRPVRVPTDASDVSIDGEGGNVKAKFSLKSDSQGRELSDAQAAYFQNSVVRDDAGRLLPVYHGSGAKFTEFSGKFIGTHGSAEGQGFYFTDKKSMAEGYAKEGGMLLEGYLNIQKPLSDSAVTLSRAQVKKIIKTMDPTGDEILVNYDPQGGLGYPGRAWYERSLSAAVDAIYSSSDTDTEILADMANSGAGFEAVAKTVRQALGYDGYIVRDKYDGAGVYVAFESSQFKNADNLSPTSGPDIRYSIKYTRDNDPYVAIDEDILSGVPREQWVKRVKDVLREKFPEGVTVGRNVIKINRQSQRELTYSKYTQYLMKTDPDLYADKLRAANNADEILRASRDYVNEAMAHPRKDSIQEFARGTVLMEIGGRGYSSDVVVALRSDKTLLLYDLLNMKAVEINKKTGSSDTKYPQGGTGRNAASSDTSIDAGAGDVKGKFSLKAGTEGKGYRALAEEAALLREQMQEYRALQRRSGALEKSRDYWRGETRLTKQRRADPKKVKEKARDLLRSYSAEMEQADLEARLQALYDKGLQAGEDVNAGDAAAWWDEARRIAKEIAESAVESDDTLRHDYKDLMAYLKTAEFHIGPEHTADIADFEAFRRKYFGRLKIRTKDGGTNIDQLYTEMSEQWPGMFPEDVTHPADQLRQVAEVWERLHTVKTHNPLLAENSGDMEAAVLGIENDIVRDYEGFADLHRTFADRQRDKLNAAKEKGRANAEKTREAAEQRLEQLRTRNTERTQRAIEKERQRRLEQIEKIQERFASKDAKRREDVSARALRGKIARHVRQLSDRLLRPTDKQHIPEKFKTGVASLLQAINLESPYSYDAEGRRVKNAEVPGAPTKRTAAFLALKEQYSKIAAEGGDMVIDPALFSNDAEGIQGGFDAVIALGDTRLAEMNTQQLSTVWQVVRAVEQSIRNYGKILSQSKYATTLAWVEALVRDTETRRPRTGRLDLDKSVLTPYSFFHRFGAAGEESLAPAKAMAKTNQKMHCTRG